jgi:hypothetical protein
MSALPADVARCPGFGSDEDGWREGCETCQRRTSPPADPARRWTMFPPPAITFWCQYEIPPDTSPKTGGSEG